MEVEANSLSLEEQAALEMVKANRAALDVRQAERERQQVVLRSEKLKIFKVYAEVRKKKMMDLAQKQDGLEVNDNAEVEVIIQDIRSANPDDHTYFTALRNTVIFLKAEVKENGAWNILINFLEKGTFVISTKFFEQRTYTELQVMLIKIQRTTRLNELLREHVKEILMKVGPKITEDPPMVRFMTNDLFRICYLAEDKLRDYPSNYLISVEKYLRSTGFTSTEKDKAADTLRRFLMENVPYYRKRVEKGLEVRTRLPNMPKLSKKDVNIAWLWAGVDQEVEYIGRHIQGAILKPGDLLHYPSMIDYQAANSNPMIEEDNYILINCEEIDEFLRMYDDELKVKHLGITDKDIEINRAKEFARWIKDKALMEGSTIPANVQALAMGPDMDQISRNGYKVNGYEFHTKAYGRGKRTTNSGVCVLGDCYNELSHAFYGELEEILELSYKGTYDGYINLFKCRWFDSEKGIHFDRHGIVDIDVHKFAYSNDPFVLPTQTKQVYYTPSPGKKRDRPPTGWQAIIHTPTRRREELVSGEFYQEEILHGPTVINVNDSEVIQLDGEDEPDEIDPALILVSDEIIDTEDEELLIDTDSESGSEADDGYESIQDDSDSETDT
ncbi:hypothetical protein POM88_050125 [Heracleum sosnowskyi]|uniref:DUF4216 domain-containing protein n=1 Tax=Heracleum sosnowskyi TaxID=360622 RepID=A0AAD8M222_9APIA|nr:hypothetical protein POM88_050125 [Heracleum sosnowskyi]